MTDREELLMVQVSMLQHELANAEYFCNRWRKTARMFYKALDLAALKASSPENFALHLDAQTYFEDTYHRENVKAEGL